MLVPAEYLFTAIGLSPGGSGHLTFIQNNTALTDWFL
jgi:hypothetical protein